MKKVLLSAAVIAFFTSCSKDYTCTHKNSDGTTSYVQTYASVSKSNANYLKANCEISKTEGSVTVTGGVWDSK